MARQHRESAGDRRPTADGGPFTLTVDDETFTVTLRADGGCDYDWWSGPHPYGFSSGRLRIAGDPSVVKSQPLFPTLDEHRESIRNFLGQINPNTGYIGD